MADGEGPLEAAGGEPAGAPVDVGVQPDGDGVWLTLSTLDPEGHPFAVSTRVDARFQLWLAGTLVRTAVHSGRHALADRLQRVRRS